MYEISGEIGNMRDPHAVYTAGSTSALPVKYRGNLYLQDNTGYDTPNGNIRYSVQNPIHMIIPPLYVRRYNETVISHGIFKGEQHGSLNRNTEMISTVPIPHRMLHGISV